MTADTPGTPGRITCSDSQPQISPEAMAYTEFTDRAGKSWRVWHTAPKAAELLTTLPPDWKAGWLTFECEDDKRRLAPFPANWEALPRSRLELLCRMAEPAARSSANHPLVHREERDPTSRPPGSSR